MRPRSPSGFVVLTLLAGCSSSPPATNVDAASDVTATDTPTSDEGAMDTGASDATVSDTPASDVRDVATPTDVRPDVPRDAGEARDVMVMGGEPVSMGMGGTTAIALDRSGNPSIAYGTLGGTTEVVISTRAGAAWTHETVTTLPGAVARIGYGIDAAGARRLGYAQYVSRSGVGYGFRLFAATNTGTAWATRLLADHSVNHNTAVRPHIDVTSAGAVHVVIPLTTALSAATRVRHVALDGANVVDEELAPRLPGSSFGLAIGRIAAAVHGESPLSLFTVADDESGPDTVAHFSARTGTAMVATVIGSFPDMGSSLTEVWGADLFRVATGYVAVTASASGVFGAPTTYRVFRQGAPSWTAQSIGPVRYAADNWCAATFADGTLALFVYAGVGMPVTDTEMRLLLIRPDGTHTERAVDVSVESGLFCSAVTDASSVHLAYRKRDSRIYYQRIPR